MSKLTLSSLSRLARLLCLFVLCAALGACGWLRNEFFIYERVHPVETAPVEASDSAASFPDAGSPESR